MEKYGDNLIELVTDSQGSSGQRLSTFSVITDWGLARGLELYPDVAAHVCQYVATGMNEIAFETAPPDMGDYVRIVLTVEDLRTLHLMAAICEPTENLRALADGVSDLMDRSPTRTAKLETGQWHTPFVTPQDWEVYAPKLQSAGLTGDFSHAVALEDIQRKILQTSIARAARGTPHRWPVPSNPSNVSQDEEQILFKKTMELFSVTQPMLAHVAYADHHDGNEQRWDTPYLHDTFPGWVSYRKLYMVEKLELEAQHTRNRKA